MPRFDDRKPADVVREKLNHIAAQYHNEKHEAYYCIEHGDWYLWNGNIYHPVDRRELMNHVSEYFPANETLPIKKHREILENLERLACVRACELNAEPGIAFANVFLRTDTLAADKHDKGRLCTMALDYDYDSSAIAPLWISTVGEILENDINKINCLQEFFGYCVTRETKYEKALIMLGEGATGKSTIINALVAMVGKENIAAVSLKNIAEGKHAVRLENKLVNVCSEMPRRAQDYEGEFRAVVTGELITADQKHVRTYDFRPFCKMIFAANSLPYIDDPTNAFYRRLLLLDLNNVFDEEKQDKELSSKLYEERAGILNWAIVGLKRLRERGRFHIDEYMKARITEIRMNNNPIVEWAYENITPFVTGEIVKNEAYERYNKWSVENGHNKLGSNKFGALFFELYKKYTLKNAQRPHGTDRRRIWPGLAWRTDAVEKEEQKEWVE